MCVCVCVCVCVQIDTYLTLKNSNSWLQGSSAYTIIQ